MRLSQQALELAVLQFELASTLGLADLHAAVLGAPLVKRSITEAVLAPDLLGRQAGLGLPQETNDLLNSIAEAQEAADV